MEFEVSTQKIEAERLVFDASVQLPVRAEALISGAGRGEAEVLMSDASARITRLETENDRAVLEGEIVCQAAYRLRGENNARSVSAKAVVSHVFDARGAKPGMRAYGDFTVDEVLARCENGHMVFDASVTAQAAAAVLEPLDVITGVLPEGEVELRREEIVSSKVAAENVLSFVLSDKAALPAILDARYAVMEWAEVSGLSHRPEPGGVRITGSVNMETLISGGLASRPVALVKYRLPVDKYLEMPEWLMENLSVEGRILRSSSEVEQAENGEDSALMMEAEVEICVLAEAKDRVLAVTDAYACGAQSAEISRAETDLCLTREKIRFEEPFRASVILPGDSGAVGAVCAVKARPSIADVETDGGRSTVSGVVSAQVIYVSQSDDRLMAVRSELPFSVNLSASVDNPSGLRVRAVNAEGNALMSDRVEIKCLLEFTSESAERRRVSTVSAIAPGEENKKKHGMFIVWPDNRDDAWSIAKRYGVPLEKVKNASGDGVSAGKPMVLRV